MITPGTTHIGGTRAETIIASVTAQQTVGTTVFITFDPNCPVTEASVFLVYLNGKLIQRLPHTLRSAEVVTPDYTVHRVDVIAWPENLDAPDFYFTGTGTRRAHLQWEPSTSSDVSAYIVQHSTDDTTFTNYARQETFGVLTPDVYFTSNASAIVRGTPQDDRYKTATFTLTVIDDSVNTITVTNNVTDETWNIPYLIGQPIDVLDGVSILINESPILGDELTFSIGLLPYYDTPALPAGTHYFRILAEDTVGNLSEVTTGIPVSITPPPNPVQSFEIVRNGSDFNYSIVQSDSVDVEQVYIYSNYDPTTQTVLPTIDFDNPFKSIPAEPNEIVSGVLITNSYPDGDYLFVARAVTSAGIDDNTSTPITLRLPFIPPDMAKILSLSATSGTEGSVTFKLISDKISENGWYVSIKDDTDTEVYGELFEENPTAELDAFGYTIIIPGGLLPEGNLMATIYDHNEGEKSSVSFTTDETPPEPPTNITAISY